MWTLSKGLVLSDVYSVRAWYCIMFTLSKAWDFLMCSLFKGLELSNVYSVYCLVLSNVYSV